MITAKNFTTEWQTKIFTDTKPKNLTLERAMHALCLLELISNMKVDFVFKGGTSLMLLLEKLNRFSVDIDVLMLEENLETFISKIQIEDSVFIRYEEDERAYRGIKKKHFKFFYISKIDKDAEYYVILDIVYEPIPYKNYVYKKLKFDFIDTIDPYIDIKIPVIEEILADKLTAFGPKTIGIKYSDEKYTEIIKQLFDISILYQKADLNADTILNTYKVVSKHEIQSRELKGISYLECIEDSLEALRLLLSNGTYGNRGDYALLKRGITGFDSFVKDKFTINAAFQHASNAYIMYVILKNNGVKSYQNNIEKIEKISLKKTFMKSSYKVVKQFIDNYSELEMAIRLNEFATQ